MTSNDLQPGNSGLGTFAFGASVRLTQQPSAAGMNVVQRGFAKAGESQWKLQVDAGRASCRFSDGTTAGTVLTAKSDALVVGDWYKLKCSRLPGNTFELRVTDKTDVTKSYLAPKAIGAILPIGNARIGAKSTSATGTDATTDQFHGDLDDIFFHKD